MGPARGPLNIACAPPIFFFEVEGGRNLRVRMRPRGCAARRDLRPYPECSRATFTLGALFSRGGPVQDPVLTGGEMAAMGDDALDVISHNPSIQWFS